MDNITARKVKCDEGKPACKRCLSTGRTCDGYNTPFRGYHHSQQPLRPLAPAQNLCLDWNITGSTTERQFFHTCKLATEAGVALHVNNASLFWRSWAPRLAHHEDAIKHALAALGATYHLMKVIGWGRKSATDVVAWSRFSYFTESIELSIVKQYTLAIEQLRGRIASDHPDGAVVTLACCLIFICIDNLRLNHRGAMAHLKHAIRIIKNSFDIGRLYHQCFLSPSTSPEPAKAPISQLLSDEEIWSMFNAYRQLEISEGLFSRSVTLTLVRRLYAASPCDDGSNLPERFDNLEEVYKARVKLNTDVLAFTQEMGVYSDDSTRWDSHEVRERHAVLQSRATAILQKYNTYQKALGHPALGTRECASCWLDKLRNKMMQLLLSIMPVGPQKYLVNIDNLLTEVVEIIEQALHAASAFVAKSNSRLDFTTDGSFIAPMYFSYVHTTDDELKRRIVQLLDGNDVLEGPWDPKYVRLLQVAEGPAADMERPQSVSMWKKMVPVPGYKYKALSAEDPFVTNCHGFR
ncbi:hypothetical protein BX600DRAFT_518502 [Xylariales sp. PMI_506]|nr:hypothetical protein BX600DRAFT_518502 [Xylariales sp. PMI_506]